MRSQKSFTQLLSLLRAVIQISIPETGRPPLTCRTNHHHCSALWTFVQEAHQTAIVFNCMCSAKAARLRTRGQCVAPCLFTFQFSYVVNYIAQWQREPAARKQCAEHIMEWRSEWDFKTSQHQRKTDAIPLRHDATHLYCLGTTHSSLSNTLQQTVQFCLGRTTTATSNNNNKYSPIQNTVTTQYLFSWKKPVYWANATTCKDVLSTITVDR